MTATAELLGCAGDGQRAPKAQVPPAAFLGRREGGRWEVAGAWDEAGEAVPGCFILLQLDS